MKYSIEISNTKDGTRIKVPPAKNPIVFIFIIAFNIVFWAMVIVARELSWFFLNEGSIRETLIIIHCLAGYVLGNVGNLFIGIWSYWGSEEIIISKDRVHLKRVGLWRGRSRSFALEDLSQLKIVEDGVPKNRNSLRNLQISLLTGGPIVFCVKNRNYRMGLNLDHSLARQIIHTLIDHPQFKGIPITKTQRR